MGPNSRHSTRKNIMDVPKLIPGTPNLSKYMPTKCLYDNSLKIYLRTASIAMGHNKLAQTISTHPRWEEKKFVLLLQGHSSPSEVITPTEEAKSLIEKANLLAYSASPKRYEPQVPLQVLVIWTLDRIKSNLWQSRPLMWVHLSHCTLGQLTSKFNISFIITCKACTLAKRILVRVSDKIVLLFSIQNMQSLWGDSLVFQLMMTDIY